MSREPRLLSQSLNQVLTDVTSEAAQNPSEVYASKEVTSELQRTAEALLFAPKLIFWITGHNAALPVLAKTFGTSEVEELLRNDELSFVLQSHFVGFSDAIQGAGHLPIIFSGRAVDSENCDPLASAEFGMRTWGEWISIDDARRLSTLAAERTLLPGEDICSIAIERVVRAYRDGLLSDFGLNPDRDITETNNNQRMLLAVLSKDILNATIAFQHEYDILEAEETWGTLSRFTAKFRGHDQIFTSVESILKLEQLPSITALLERRIMDFKDILAFRKRPETAAFRKWLWLQPNPQDARSVSETYLATMAPKIDRKKAELYKAGRITTSSLIGSGLGTLAGLPFGPTMAAAGMVAGAAVSLGISLADSFWVDRILKRINPRQFATELITPVLAREVAKHLHS